MSETTSGQSSSHTDQNKADRSSLWAAINWVRVIVGIALVAEGGVLYAHSRMDEGGPLWIVGAIAILVGALMALPGVVSICRSRLPEIIIAEPLPGAPEQTLPMLGALLVYKYRLITEEQLEKALEIQRKDGTNRRLLGGVLLDMGLISTAELQTALEHQRALVERKPQPDDVGANGQGVDVTEALTPVGSAR
jgi:hypothetical protein